MGNDGGSIPKRVDMVRFKKKEVKADQQLLSKPRSQYCSFTKEKFEQPLCIDKLGYIFNYESILRALLDQKIPKQFRHIKKLKDIKKISFQESNDQEYIIQCPISKQVFNGNTKFNVNWNCGCVFSQKAEQELFKQNSSSKCFICQKQQNSIEFISLNLTSEQQLEQQKQILQVQEQTNSKQIQNNAKNANDYEKQTLNKNQRIQYPNDQNIQKKVKQSVVTTNQFQQNILDQINFNLHQESQIYKSIFHKNYKESEDQLFNRNVRHGIR